MVLLVNLIWKAVNWAVDYFVITSERILLTSGLFTRSVAMMPLSKVTDMSFHRSFAGRLLGFGEFVVESAGQDQALRKIDHIPYPEQLYLVVCGRIFKDSAGQDDGTGDVVEVRDDFRHEVDDTYVLDGGPDSQSTNSDLSCSRPSDPAPTVLPFPEVRAAGRQTTSGCTLLPWCLGWAQNSSRRVFTASST